MTSLADTQALLWRLITAPESAATHGAAVDVVVTGDERLSPASRVDVYGGMYFARLQDAIRENFPALAAALGDEVYRALVNEYLGVHPSRHFSLRELGARLEAFLREHPRFEAPWAADLAAFEWAFLGAFDASDATEVGAEALEGLAAEEWAELCFRFAPSLRLLELGFAVAPSWERVGRGESFEPPVRTPTRYRLWRREHEVFYRPIDETEWEALVAAGKGTFGDVCAAVAERVGEEAAPRTAFEILSRWMNDGIVVSVAR